MSVPVNKRKSGKLEVNVLASNLCVYTIRITENEKHFPLKYRSFTEKLQNLAIEIYLLTWQANEINVKNDKKLFVERIKKQKEAYNNCLCLKALIEIARPIYHLSNKRCMYWITLVDELQKKIYIWSKNDFKRLKPD